jgi:elongation factor P
VATYSTNEFRKGLKIQIDGEPYLMIECNFVKPGKGNAFYKCKMRNLIRNTVLDRTYKGGDSLEAADVEELAVQYLYRQGDTFVFMDNKTYEQYELASEQVDDNWKYLKEGMVSSMVLHNGLPITMTPPNHVELSVEYCEPGAKGNTATNVTKSVKVETGAEFQAPAFIEMGNVIKIDTRTGQYVERVSTK